ncbi:MAG: type II toxin-antitoxin system RelB/DinJ family antitoxin [Bacteroidaceae bacterium]|nr:type II toxin-antitoxin system RelB/DinJ family antitoxin [Selenomonadaceae bacterium]MBQ3772180.1 type II toxin-antitoxin system RelB/DinJ family antitoxin [Bacteroidaceae bacterium]
MSTSLIQVRVEDSLKIKATQIYSDLGLDISTAVRMFLKRTVIENGIPFNMVLPQNKYVATKGLKALSEINDVSQKAGVSDMTLEEINAEIELVRRDLGE